MGVYWKYSSNNLFVQKKEFSKSFLDKNEVTDTDVDEANSPTNLINASDDKDDFVDID